MSQKYACSKVIITLIPAILLLTSKSARGQEIDHQFWLNYAITIPINEKVSWGGDTGLRGLGSNRDWNQILVRPTVTYRFKRSFGIAGAMAWLGTFNNGDYNISEFRIHQDLNLRWPDLGFIQFIYRIRLEQRFFFYEADIPNAFKVRLRGLIGLETDDIHLFGGQRPIYFQLLFEGFRTVDREEALEVFVNQTRFHAAMGHRISANFRYELHYIAQRSRLFNEDGNRAAQNLYRVRLFHRLPGKK